MKKSVLVSILHQHNMEPVFANIVTAITNDRRYRVTVEYPSDQPESHNRSLIANRFKDGGWDYLLMIDGNDTIPTFNPLDLADLDKDVVAAAVPQWRENDIYWVALDKVDGGYKPIPPARRGGLQQVDAVGSACMCIKREVLERIEAPFEIKWSKDGLMETGFDFYFCDKVKKAGFEVWVDWRKTCDHLKRISLLAVLNLLTGGNRNG